MMNKIKDLIYNLNDVFVALAIIAVAAFIILWRVGTIMDYPAYAASMKKENVAQADVNFTDVDLTPGKVDENLNKNPENFDAPGSENEQPAEPRQEENPSQNEGEAQQGATVSQETKFEIPAGSSCDKIGTLLEEQGLIASKSEFIKQVVAKKADTKIKTGKFTIPAGASLDDIIAIITK